MFLRDLLLSEGLIQHRDQEMMHCCFHQGDNSPSMQVHRNHCWCYAESRKYTYADFARKFSVLIDYDPPSQTEVNPDIVRFGENKEYGWPKHTPLFEYPFTITPLPKYKHL